jgi:uncharacterized protein HemX
MAEEQQIDVEGGPVKIKATSSQFILIMAFMAPVLAAGAGVWYVKEHEAAAAERDARHLASDKEVTQAIRDSAKSLDQLSRMGSLQTCIMSKDQKFRETEFTNPNSMCRQITGTAAPR